ncbi:MAG: elongation factor G [Clostridia bacterium]|nr:elongation factor G [Clostridia bacterium]
MNKYQKDKIRNIAMIGHGGDGKTTLTEAMLFNANATDRFGKVEDGTTVSDFDQEEIRRQISISTSVAPCEWKNHKINIIDTPGYFDFVGEMLEGVRVADGAVIVLSAVSGVVVGTEKAWDYTTQRDMPKMFFINQMDRENANFNKTIEQLKEKYGTAIAPLQVPIMDGAKFKGFVDVVNMRAREFDGKNIKDIDIPSGMEEQISPVREMIVEAVAENDDELLEKYFAGEELTNEEIRNGLRDGVVKGRIVPVMCGAAAINAGVQVLMDNILDFMPSPVDRPCQVAQKLDSDEQIELNVDEKGPFAALVFKTIADPFVGKLSIFKVYSGEINSDSVVYNPNREQKEKVAQIYFMKGKKQISTDKVSAGDIAAVSKLQYTMTGDTLCDPSNKVKLDEIDFPETSISMAVQPKSQGDEEKISSGLQRLSEEDPTFKIEKNAETKELLISGVGELHLEVITKRLQNKFGVEVVLNEPKIPYRETIKKKVSSEGKHKKQSGGHGQYGHVFINFEPAPEDAEEDFVFVDKIVGGVVPRQYIPAVEKGLKECIEQGVLAGYPVVKLQCTLYDGSYHPVDSSEMAFKVAASIAYKKGLAEANPVILEPVMRVEVLVPEEYMGDVIGDINRRRGRILGMNPKGSQQQVVAEVPQAEMFRYTTDLRSMTQARGSFTARFERYEEVPPNIAEKIIEESKKEE